jgi:hypothetical protein
VGEGKKEGAGWKGRCPSGFGKFKLFFLFS